MPVFQKENMSNARFSSKIIYWLLFFSICIFSIDLSESGSCSEAVHVDFTESVMGSTNCANKAVSVTLTNAYRAYCVGGTTHCENYHKGFSGKLLVKGCVPVPDNDDDYVVVKHTNVAGTCDNGATTEYVDVEYVNATKCSCKLLLTKTVLLD